MNSTVPKPSHNNSPSGDSDSTGGSRVGDRVALLTGRFGHHGCRRRRRRWHDRRLTNASSGDDVVLGQWVRLEERPHQRIRVDETRLGTEVQRDR